MSYSIFWRTWWRKNRSWPNGLEPEPGKRHYVATAETIGEARALCKQYQSEHGFTAEQLRLGAKFEFEGD